MNYPKMIKMNKLKILGGAILLLLISISFFCIWSNGKYEIRSPKPDNPLEREQWRMARKGGFTDPFTIMEARKNFMKKFKAEENLKDSGINNWTSEGPIGIGGRAVSYTHLTLPTILLV